VYFHKEALFAKTKNVLCASVIDRAMFIVLLHVKPLLKQQFHSIVKFQVAYSGKFENCVLHSAWCNSFAVAMKNVVGSSAHSSFTFITPKMFYSQQT